MAGDVSLNPANRSSERADRNNSAHSVAGCPGLHPETWDLQNVQTVQVDSINRVILSEAWRQARGVVEGSAVPEA
jgi:hypothetical protein